MARAIWSGVISFGMVSIPVKLYPATESKDIAFHLLHKECHNRVKQQRFCPYHETVIDWSDVERGYEWSKDQYVVLDEGDFDKVPVATTKTIEITGFVGLEEVDPQYYDRSYYYDRGYYDRGYYYGDSDSAHASGGYDSHRHHPR